MPTTKNRSLKQVSLQFRTLASRAVRSNSEDARVNLRRLLAFVDDTPLLRTEIDRAPTPAGDVMALWERTRSEHERLTYPDDPLEELGLLHALLTEFAQPRPEDFWSLCFFYDGMTHRKDCVKEVLHDVCGRYMDHLRGVIEAALLESDDPAYDSRRIEVHVSGGNNQLNVAQDRARIDARQTVGADAGEILRLARELAAAAAEAASTTGSEEAAELEEISTAVADALERPKPSRFTLRMAVERLELLATAIGSASTLAPYVTALGPQALQLAARVGEWVSAVPK
jgi:hypothetical protein